MALAWLLSRVIHTLRDMARSSEWMVARKKRYGGGAELAELWEEFQLRFQLDFSPHQERIEYLDRLRVVLNWTVHNGGQAILPQPFDKVVAKPGDILDDYDTSFSAEYPEFVEGSDFSAQVVVSQEQLECGVDYSIEIVKWDSEQLRAKEIETERERNQMRGFERP